MLCAVLLAFYLELLCLTFEKVSLPMPVVGSGGMLFFIFGVDARFLSLVYLAKFLEEGRNLQLCPLPCNAILSQIEDNKLG